MAADTFVKPCERVGSIADGLASPMQRALIFDTDSGFTVTSVDDQVIQGPDGASITGYYLVTWSGLVDASTSGVTYNLGTPTGGPPAYSQSFKIDAGTAGTVLEVKAITDGGTNGVIALGSQAGIILAQGGGEDSVQILDGEVDVTSSDKVKIDINSGAATIQADTSSITVTFGSTSISINGTRATITTQHGQMELDAAGVLSLKTANAAPSGTPSGKCYLWLDPGDGKLKARPPSGTTTDIAP